MTLDLKSSLAHSLDSAASAAGLVLLANTEGRDFDGRPTAVAEFCRPGAEATGRALRLELSADFDLGQPEMLPTLTAHLAEEANRLRNPRPECYVTLEGLPLAFGQFQWPFRRSTSGADTHILHGEIRLADGAAHNLHAKIAASVTLTFAEIVPSLEQPFAETFIYNAVRKLVDLGQLEFVKSGNRQPVPVTTRYYSRWQKKFLFTESTDAERLQYLLRKVYWLSGVLGEGKPVWIADPRDAQYLNTTAEDLLRMAGHEEGEGLVELDGEFAAATPKLMEQADEYRANMEAALAFARPQFNESMRAGHANM